MSVEFKFVKYIAFLNWLVVSELIECLILEEDCCSTASAIGMMGLALIVHYDL